MIYRSNLDAPDLTGRFKLKDPPLITMGHDMPSDPDWQPGCGFWTADEAAILYHCAARVGGIWLDIGSRFGWTAAHILEAGAEDVYAVDPEYQDYDFLERAFVGCPQMIAIPQTSADFFRGFNGSFVHFAGIVIDGNHDAPEPFNDAMNAALLSPTVILLHDFQGEPVRDAVSSLMRLGWQCRVYDTPNGVAALWRDKTFAPPCHVPDPAIDWAQIRSRYSDFDYSRCV